MPPPEDSRAARAGWLSAVKPPEAVPNALVVQSIGYSVGEGVFLAGSVVFFTRYAGLDPNTIALGLTVSMIVQLVTRIPLGGLADSLGASKAWAIASAAQCVAFAAYPAVHSALAFYCAVVFLAVARSLGGSARGSYMGAALDRSIRVEAQAYLRATINVGFVVGPLLAALAISIDSRPGYVFLVEANAVTYAVEVLLLLRFLPWAAPSGEVRRRTFASIRQVSFLGVAACFAVLDTAQIILEITFPLWLLERTDAPRAAVAALGTLNAVVVISLQVWASRRVHDIPSGMRALKIAAAFLVGSMACFAISDTTGAWVTVAVLGAAILLLSIGEIWTASASWAVVYDLAPDERRGEYLGTWATVNQLVQLGAPVSFTFLVLTVSAVGWTLIAVWFVLGAVACGVITFRSAWIAEAVRRHEAESDA